MYVVASGSRRTAVSLIRRDDTVLQLSSYCGKVYAVTDAPIVVADPVSDRWGDLLAGCMSRCQPVRIFPYALDGPDIVQRLHRDFAVRPTCVYAVEISALQCLFSAVDSTWLQEVRLVVYPRQEDDVLASIRDRLQNAGLTRVTDGTGYYEAFERKNPDDIAILEHSVAWGRLGTDGSLGFDSEGIKVLDPAIRPSDSVRAVSMHYPSSIRFALGTPRLVHGYLNGTASNDDRRKITMTIDDVEIGTLTKPRSQTPPILVSPGTHVLRFHGSEPNHFGHTVAIFSSV